MPLILSGGRKRRLQAVQVPRKAATADHRSAFGQIRILVAHHAARPIAPGVAARLEESLVARRKPLGEGGATQCPFGFDRRPSGNNGLAARGQQERQQCLVAHGDARSLFGGRLGGCDRCAAQHDAPLLIPPLQLAGPQVANHPRAQQGLGLPHRSSRIAKRAVCQLHAFALCAQVRSNTLPPLVRPSRGGCAVEVRLAKLPPPAVEPGGGEVRLVKSRRQLLLGRAKVIPRHRRTAGLPADTAEAPENIEQLPMAQLEWGGRQEQHPLE